MRGVVCDKTLRYCRTLCGIYLGPVNRLEFVFEQRSELSGETSSLCEQPLIETRTRTIKFLEKFARA